MWLFREILVTIVVLYTCVQAMDIRTFKKDWITSWKNFEFEPIEEVARPDNKFAFGFCKKSVFYNQLECDIKLETLSELSPSDETKVCNIKLTSRNQEKEVRAIILQLNLFGDNKILVTEMNDEHVNDDVIYLRYSILDMDKCLKNEVMISYGRDSDISKSGVIVYNDSFDIIMTDKQSCGSADTCRVTFDQWGKRIAGPVSFPLNLNNLAVFPVQYLSPAEGFYVVGHNNNHDKLLVTRLSLDGKVTRLMTVEHSDNYITHKESSNNYNSFSTCWSKLTGSKEVHCVQFAARDDLIRLNVTLPVVENTSLLALYNLPDGLLLVTITGSQGKCNSFEVTKVFTNGRKSSFVIGELDLHCSVAVISIKVDVKDDGNEICFNFVNEEPVYEEEKFIKRSMQFRSKCVSKHDLEKL